MDWTGEIDQFHFTGSPAMDEMVFFHRASRTAILADLSRELERRIFSSSTGHPGRGASPGSGRSRSPWGLAPLELRLSWFKRADARAARDRLLAEDPEKVIMAHGEWQRSDGRAYLTRVFAWLG